MELPAVVPVDHIISWATIGVPTRRKSRLNFLSFLSISLGTSFNRFSLRKINRQRTLSSTSLAITAPQAAPRIPNSGNPNAPKIKQ